MRLPVLGLLALGALLVGACAPTATAPAATAAPAKPAAGAATTAPAAAKAQASPAAGAPAAKDGWQAEWDKTVAAAKNEKLVMMTHPGTDYQKLVASFQKAYPDIPVEHTGARPSDFSPKVITEQKNGQFLWDVMTANTANMNNVLLPTGAFQELPPQLIRPEIQDDSKWSGGFEMWTTTTGKFVFIMNVDVQGGVWVNRDQVKKDQLGTVAQLLDPQFQGKIVIDEPSVPAHGALGLVGILDEKGPEFVEKLLRDQKPVFQENVRITTEWVATGRYPVGIGVDDNQMIEFQKQGIGKNVERLDEAKYGITAGVAVFKNAPHPNAAKVWVNWLLTQEGQQAWADSGVTGNSRRTDVPPQKPQNVPQDWSVLASMKIQGMDSGKASMRTVTDTYKKIKA